MVKYSGTAFCSPSFPARSRGQKGACIPLEIQGDPCGDAPTQHRTESKRVQMRSTTHIPPKWDRGGAFIPQSDIYCLPTMFALTGSSG